jgi:hypothetical protein
MKIHDLKRTSGKAVLSVWLPQVLVDVGARGSGSRSTTLMPAA